MSILAANVLKRNLCKYSENVSYIEIRPVHLLITEVPEPAKFQVTVQFVGHLGQTTNIYLQKSAVNMVPVTGQTNVKLGDIILVNNLYP